ncbi:MAG: hypothetical protein IPL61_26930 [Myxococcales bacterium]|nr:hypothetical protein [Myxococcales bacterium]
MTPLVQAMTPLAPSPRACAGGTSRVAAKLVGNPGDELRVRAFRGALALALSLAACAGNSAAATDAGVCSTCTADEICIQVMHSNIDDPCQSLGFSCAPRRPECVGATCTPGCDFWQCGDGTDAGMLSCSDLRTSQCPNAISGALQCWGP